MSKSQEENLKTVEKMLSMVDTKEQIKQFVEVFAAVLEVIKTLKADTIQEQETLKKLYQEAQKQLAKQVKDKLATIKQPKYGKDGKTPTTRELVALMKPLIPQVENGKDADEEMIIQEVLKKIDEQGEPLTGDAVVQTINDSSTTETIAQERVEGLTEALQELRSRPVGRGGGGVSAIGVRQAFKYIGKTEKPTGAINGSNKVYTVSQDIFYVFGFMLNGEQIAELPNFTYSGKTITFSTALPSSFSGKDFEIKYV